MMASFTMQHHHISRKVSVTAMTYKLEKVGTMFVLTIYHLLCAKLNTVFKSLLFHVET
jgi:hypothetical protein